MDGADSESLISEPEALGELPSLDVHFPSLRITEQDGPTSTEHTRGDGNEPSEPSMDNKLEKPQSMVRYVDGAP